MPEQLRTLQITDRDLELLCAAVNLCYHENVGEEYDPPVTEDEWNTLSAKLALNVVEDRQGGRDEPRPLEKGGCPHCGGRTFHLVEDIPRVWPKLRVRDGEVLVLTHTQNMNYDAAGEVYQYLACAECRQRIEADFEFDA